MVTTTASDRRRDVAAAGSRWASDRPRRHPSGAGRRRRWPHLFVGVLLVVACAAGVVVLTQQLGEREAVLVVARPVTAGQVVTDADVGEARVATDAAVAVIPADARQQVVGRTAAVDLRPGSLLTERLLGQAEVPAAGEAVVALSVKPGRYPPRLSAGASVHVIPVASEETTGKEDVAAPEGGGWAAVVLDVAVAGAQRQQGAVITLRLPDAAAREVAALGEDAASVVLTPGRGGG